MTLSYEDLIEPTIVKQVSRTVAYCRCTRTKNPPFCDGSHAATYCDGTHGRLVKPKERPPRPAPKSAAD